MNFKEEVLKLIHLPRDLRQWSQDMKDVHDVEISRIERRMDALFLMKRPPLCMVFIIASMFLTDEHGYYGGRVEKVSKTTLALSEYINTRHMFSFQPNFPIFNLQFLICSDLTRVKIDSITCANQSISASYECMPVAYFDGRVGPENRITIQVSER